MGNSELRIEVIDGAERLADRAADLVSEHAMASVVARGICAIAVSGGRTPRAMFAALAKRPLPWSLMHVFQVDERVAPNGHPDRNSTGLKEELLGRVSDLPADHVHLMPVDAADLERGCEIYSATLHRICGGVLDLVHLGLGDDGHTASLAPGDPVLDVHDRDVALSERYRGRVRMTLTLPALNRAGAVLWLVAGSDKAAALQGLLAGDRALPAAHVRNPHQSFLADGAAAAHLPERPS